MAHILIKPNQGDIRYRFIQFSHPFVNLFAKQVNKYGIEGLLDPQNEEAEELKTQQIKIDEFETQYTPGGAVTTPYPIKEIDFSFTGAYSNYNWELFFHIPMMLAEKLSKNQKFEEAQKWYHYIFDPTVSEGGVPDRFWKIKPFAEYNGSLTITNLMDELNFGNTEIEMQTKQWKENPFNPHLLARLRVVAYMKNVLMKYLDNLIAWGDSLFRQDTAEYINEATQIYILAAKILGRRPVRIPQDEPTAQSFANLKNALDSFSNVMVYIENNLYKGPSPDACSRLDAAITSLSLKTSAESVTPKDLGSLTSVLYFCIPENKKMLSYWDTVADRLFKIRHCMNIEGVERELSLFESPIDPGLLVKASAMGVSIGDAIGELASDVPNYRFRFMVQKAMELANDVKSLGQSFLSALEKKDAEQLALLRSGHETNLLKAIKAMKEHAVEEADENLKSLELSKQNIEFRKEFYSSREYLNSNETLHLKKLESAHKIQTGLQLLSSFVGVMGATPEFKLGMSGVASPVITVDYGGIELSKIAQAPVDIANIMASILNYQANRASIMGGYDRRRDDWTFQADSANKELKQIEKQILAAQIRKAMAEKDLENHLLQTEQSEEAKAFMESKFTNKELYEWMSGELASLYFQSYQLAYDTARKAEVAYRFETGKEDSSFIQYGNWDSLKKGLLSGDKLYFQLRQMEADYLENNERECEITKHISLAMLNPDALIDLRANGTCTFNLPEVLFDMDFPGQYFRRIKSVSLTIPAVTGPYTGINCRLSISNTKFRKSTDITTGYQEVTGEDERFTYDPVVKTVATSSGRNDAGMFEVNFNDERYLPFEGRGAIGTWQLELPELFRQFDYDTVSDVILTLHYTARESDNMKDTIKSYLSDYFNDTTDSIPNWYRMISLKSEFPDQYHELLTDLTGGTSIEISKKHIPYFFRDKTIEVKSLTIVSVANGACDISINSGTAYTLATKSEENPNYYYGDFTINNKTIKEEGDSGNGWSLLLSNIGSLTSDDFEDIIMLLEYNIS